jgi:hypothetical protein
LSRLLLYGSVSNLILYIPSPKRVVTEIVKIKAIQGFLEEKYPMV